MLLLHTRVRTQNLFMKKWMLLFFIYSLSVSILLFVINLFSLLLTLRIVFQYFCIITSDIVLSDFNNLTRNFFKFYHSSLDNITFLLLMNNLKLFLQRDNPKIIIHHLIIRYLLVFKKVHYSITE